MFNEGDIVQTLVPHSRGGYASYRGKVGEVLRISSVVYDDGSFLARPVVGDKMGKGSFVLFTDEVTSYLPELPYDPNQMPDEEDDI